MAKENFINREMGMLVTEIFESRKKALVFMFGGALLVLSGVLLIGTTLAVGLGAGVIVGGVGLASISIGFTSIFVQTVERFMYGN